VQLAALTPLLNIPLEHSRQLCCAMPLWYSPALHESQKAMPWVLVYIPTEQATQSDSDVPRDAALIRPSAHFVHVRLPLALQEPISQPPEHLLVVAAITVP
jgi:hypothetical protein